MGLDMYAYTCDADSVGDQQVDIKTHAEDGGHLLANFDREFAYWRKFNHLHGWMEKLYREKGGTARGETRLKASSSAAMSPSMTTTSTPSSTSS